MSDFIWYIIVELLFVLLGFIFIKLGLQIWKKQRMDLIIAYHHDKVSEDNKQAYCVLSGIGVLIIGCGLLLSGICALTVRSAYVFIPMATGLILGIALLISAGMRYNR
ncbi:MAG: hypothetical protein IKI61_08465 [Erysipelotrichaceae bacterium]|nr:hypothetical protein [Erysipelotrichaceae bacterium]